jgi:hypothetical protein
MELEQTAARKLWRALKAILAALFVALASACMGSLAVVCAVLGSALLIGAVGTIGLCLGASAALPRGSAWQRWCLSVGIGGPAGLAAFVVGAGMLGPRLAILFGLVAGLVTAILLSVVLARRRPKAAGPKRPLLALVACIGLAAGAVLGAFAAADEAPREFPALTAAAQTPMAGEKAQAVLADMARRFPIHEDTQLRAWAGGEWPEPGTDDWHARATAVTRGWADCLAAPEALLAEPGPGSVAPAAGSSSGPDASELSVFVRSLGQLLLLRSELALEDGDWNLAISSARNAVSLGLGFRSTGLTEVVGTGVARRALEQVREIAATDGVPKEQVTALQDGLPAEGRVRDGTVASLADEYLVFCRLVDELNTFSPVLEDAGADRRTLALGRTLFRRAPGLKPKQTRNMMGECVTRLVNELAAYRPPPTVEDLLGPGRPAPSDSGTYMTRTYKTTNPGGAVLVLMSLPTFQMAYERHFELLAELRLTRLLVALRHYQMDNGRLPDSLDSLAPDYLDVVPHDPFADRPFIYEPRAERPLLASPGPDLERDTPDDESPDDIVVEVTFAGRAA